MASAKYTLTLSDDLPETTGGRCYYPWFPKFGTCKIVLRPKYSTDTGILNHEIKHAEQYRDNFFHTLLSKFSKKYRYKIELEAYTEQIKAYKYTKITQAKWIVNALLTKYDLDVSEAQITEDVRAIIKSVKPK